MGFFEDHAGDATLRTFRLYYLGLVTPIATVAGAISAGARTVTPSSMTGIVVGAVLAVTDADGTAAESVTVTAVTPSTFTATFANAHGAGWLFNTPAPLYWTDLTDHDIETASGDICGAHRWLSMGITESSVNNQPSGATASFKVPDTDASLFRLFDAQNGGELAPAAIYQAGFLLANKSAAPDGVEVIFTGRIDRASVDSDTEDAIEVVLMPPTQEDAAELPLRLISTLVRIT